MTSTHPQPITSADIPQRAAALFALLLASVPALFAAPTQPRLGIISEPVLRAEADLLTVELGKLDVALLERGEINRVLAEQALQLGDRTRDKVLRVGRLLGADGLLFLDDAPGKKEEIQVRLVAVDPGVIVWSDRFEAKAVRGGREAWTGSVGSLLAPLLPKLSVKRTDAVPLSLLRLRASVANAHGRGVERDLNRLLFWRLLREPKVFVLERENLMALEEEKRWGGGTTDFWTGSRLLDGTIDIDLADPARLHVGIRLRGENRKDVITVAQDGSAEALPELVAGLVARALANIGVEQRATAWDPLQEAREFFRLSGWAAGHVNRRAAVDAAWALGYRSPDIARSRLGLMAWESEFGPEVSETRYSYFGAQPRRELQTWLSEHDDLLGEYLARNLALAEFWLHYRPPDGRALKGREQGVWEESGRKTLNKVVQCLWWLHSQGAPAEQAMQTAELQGLGRAMAERLLVPVSRQRREVADRLVGSARYLDNTPAALRETYRKILLLPRELWLPNTYDIRRFSRHRLALLQHDAFTPMFANTGATKAFRDEWLREFRQSDEPERRLVEIEFQVRAADSRAEKQRLRQEMLNIMWEHRDMVAAGHIDPYHFLHLPLSGIANGVFPGLKEDTDREYARRFFIYVLDHTDCGMGPLMDVVSRALFGEYYRDYKPAEAAEVDAAFRRLKASNRNKHLAYQHKWLLKWHPDLDVDKPEPLQVSRRIALPCPEGGDLYFPRFSVNTMQIVEDRFWVYWPPFVHAIDVDGGAVTTIPGSDEMPTDERRMYLAVTPEFLAVFFIEFNRSGNPTHYFIRARKEGAPWVKHEMAPQLVNRPLVIGDALYCPYQAPGPTGSFATSHYGILRIALPSGKVRILSDSLGAKGAPH